MSEIKDRIQMILDYYGISQAEFAKRANLSTGYANNPGKTVTVGTREKISNAFPDINMVWFQTGVGKMTTEIQEVVPVPEDAYMMAEFAILNGKGGRLGGADVANLPETKTRLVPREYEKGNYLVVKITGNSMNDGTDRSISDGDDILIRELEPDEWDDLPIRTRLFVITSREGNVIKQITEVNKEDGYIMCHSFNSSYEDFKINFSDIYQIFVVYKIVQKQITL